MTVLSKMQGGLTVSCQAYPGEAMRDPGTMAQVAQAVVAGGASALRAQGLEDIRAIRQVVDVPIVGIWKDGDDGVFITPTLRHAEAVIAAGAQVLALDGTRRKRPDGLTLAETIAHIREGFAGPIMADCGCLEDALAAQDAGATLLGTTLAGYTPDRPKTPGPDFELLDDMVAKCTAPIVVEGRIHTPAQVREAFDRGAFSVCVGTAITHPTTITTWFVSAAASSRGSHN